jgi:hypothetical protein
MLLEKAWAKAHTDYESIEAGHSIETFRNLLGIPGEYIDISNHVTAWNKVK